MFKRILLILIVALIGTLIYFSATSETVKIFKEGKNINVLVIFDDIEDKKNINFLIAKYSSLNKYIKLSFIDENITILYKTKKARILKEMILETVPEKRIDFIKTEIEKLFDNKIVIDYYICLNNKIFKNIIKDFSDKKDENINDNFFKIYSGFEFDRDTRIVALIKIFNYMYNNFNRFVFIRLIKDFYNKNIVIKTNFKLADLFLIYSNLLNEDKIIKYADIPVLNRRKRIEVDESNKQKIIDFFNNDEFIYKDNLRIEVLNTTNKNRLAIKASNELRENNFDVVDWGATSQKYEFTTIFDLENNYEKIKEIKNVLNCGEILFRPKEKPLIEGTIFLGQDCNIYDKLDRHHKEG